MAYVGFSKLKEKLSHEKGITNPGALAASIGRKKYGKKAFQKHASAGTSMASLNHAVDHPEYKGDKKDNR